MKLLNKLPSGRSWDDVKVTEVKTTMGKFMVFKVRDAWRLIFKTNGADYYDLVTNGTSFAQVYDTAHQYLIKQTECYIKKLERMILENEE